MEVPVLIVWAAFGIIGRLIGASRGRPNLGGFLGIMLGPLGWLVIIAAGDDRPKCRECGAVLSPGARRCMTCGQPTAPVAQTSPLPAARPAFQPPAPLPSAGVSTASGLPVGPPPTPPTRPEQVCPPSGPVVVAAQVPQRVRFTCTTCGTAITAKAMAAGKSYPCPKCHKLLRVPELPKVQPASGRADKASPSDRVTVWSVAAVALGIGMVSGFIGGYEVGKGAAPPRPQGTTVPQTVPTPASGPTPTVSVPSPDPQPTPLEPPASVAQQLTPPARTPKTLLDQTADEVWPKLVASPQPLANTQMGGGLSLTELGLHFDGAKRPNVNVVTATTVAKVVTISGNIEFDAILKGVVRGTQSGVNFSLPIETKQRVVAGYDWSAAGWELTEVKMTAVAFRAIVDDDTNGPSVLLAAELNRDTRRFVGSVVRQTPDSEVPFVRALKAAGRR